MFKDRQKEEITPFQRVSETILKINMCHYGSTTVLELWTN